MGAPDPPYPFTAFVGFLSPDLVFIYLGSDQTLKLMQTEYIYPTLGDRSSPKEWVENGKPDLLANATQRKETILSEPSNARFDPEAEAALRAAFNIHLNH